MPNPSYIKGRSFEYEVRNAFTDCGLACRRVYGSGSGIEKGDLVLTLACGKALKGEAKRRARLPSYLTSALDQHDFTVFREDRGNTFVLLTLDRFKEMAGGGMAE
jgi:Holliday junction resolvase